MRVMDTRAEIFDVMKTTPLHATKVNLGASPAETTMPLVQDKVLKQEILPMSSGSSQGMPSHAILRVSCENSTNNFCSYGRDPENTTEHKRSTILAPFR